MIGAGQEFAVSAVAAGFAHIIHHPLYTLKSQMMYHGSQFRLTTFMRRSYKEPGGFLFSGERALERLPMVTRVAHSWGGARRTTQRNNDTGCCAT